MDRPRSFGSIRKDVANAYRFGANSYIVKPASPDELFNILMLVKNYWLRVNRLV
jgi:DNA-binding NarL/FixJ family response regulator